MSSSAFGLECQDLSRDFGDRSALDGLCLRVAPGSLTALLGSNGAGKTTLMKILATLLLPTGGKASLLGKDVVGFPEHARRVIGYVPAEERSFHGRLTVIQNLEFFAALHGISRRECLDRAQPLLATFGLEGHVRARFSELSSGMKQILALLRALIPDPPILLLDEPTRSLSPDLARRARELLLGLAHQEGKSILLATHNLGEAEAVADEIAILHRGRILAQGPPAALYEAHGVPEGPRLEALFDLLTGSGERIPA